MIPLWSGIPNTWDCDEMGHMNVRVYVEKAMEGLGNFCRRDPDAPRLSGQRAFDPDGG